MRRTRTLVLSSLAGAAAMFLAACAQTSDVRQNAPHESGPFGASITIEHIHAATRDPRDGTLLLATHEGLFRQSGTELLHIGPNLDLMGFTVAPDGTYYASGHPGPESTLPQPLGLISSIDRGASWSVRSRGGESDFHALDVGPQGVVGHDGALRTTSDMVTWNQQALPSPAADLAVSPKTGRILATTQNGLLSSSDRGRTWTALNAPGLVAMVAFADERTVVGATTEGRILVSTDAGRSWAAGGTANGQVNSLSARTAADGTVELILVVGDDVFSTTDAGKTLQRLL